VSGVDAPVGPSGEGRRPAVHAAARLAGGVVLLVAMTGLVVGAVHGWRAQAAQGSPTEVARWRVDTEYYDCLAAQVHSVVQRGQTVDVSTADPGAWGTLVKVVAPYAVVSSHRTGHVVLTLVSRPGAGSCLGSVVVARYPSGAVRAGTGGSLRGSETPPQTPL
jgi:hypothetical protein